MRFATTFFLTFSILIPFTTGAEVAQTKVAELVCSDKKSRPLGYSDSYGSNTEYYVKNRAKWQGDQSYTAPWLDELYPNGIQIGRENLSDEKCKQADTQIFLSNLAANCSKYFSINSVTPLNKGYSQALTGINRESDAAMAAGYSFTDRILVTYKCL